MSGSAASQDPELLRRLLRAKDRMDGASHQHWPVRRLARVSGVSEAHSAATGSAPRAARSASWRRISARSTPRRRCDGRTDTAETPATGSVAPGTVIRRL